MNDEFLARHAEASTVHAFAMNFQYVLMAVIVIAFIAFFIFASKKIAEANAAAQAAKQLEQERNEEAKAQGNAARDSVTSAAPVAKARDEPSTVLAAAGFHSAPVASVSPVPGSLPVIGALPLTGALPVHSEDEISSSEIEQSNAARLAALAEEEDTLRNLQERDQ